MVPTIEQVVTVPGAPVVKQVVETQAPVTQQAAPAPASSQKGQLAYTGAEVGVLAGLGGLLTAAGAFLARRRKGQQD